jgi:hypothetical protein
MVPAGVAIVTGSDVVAHLEHREHAVHRGQAIDRAFLASSDLINMAKLVTVASRDGLSLKLIAG